MNLRTTGFALLTVMGLSVLACNSNNPSRPSMSFLAPSTKVPGPGASINFNQQPITLTVTNVARTGTSPVTYAVEVSKTPGFETTVFTREGIAEGTDGTTSVTLTPLTGNTIYHWRWRAVVDGVVGENSSPISFFLKPNIEFSQPDPIQPANGSNVFAKRPAFTVTNSSVIGEPAAVSYEFQVSASSSFQPVLTSGTTGQQGGGRTSWSPSVDLPESTLFWRARALDTANQITGPFSKVNQFERKFGIDLDQVVYIAPAPNISKWPETAKITGAAHSGDQLCIDWDGPNWPSTAFFGDPSTQVVANQFMFANIGGVWYGGAGHWLRPGQVCKGEVDEDFFVDAWRTPPFNSLVLHPGDVFGVMITTPTRAYPDMKTVDERSDVVLIEW